MIRYLSKFDDFIRRPDKKFLITVAVYKNICIAYVKKTFKVPSTLQQTSLRVKI